ncbi:MAG: tryptophan synthase subunit alpha [Planctomycetes bacterium]|nr:tryptophan synthase subunit alpha [Planctomycetota bacterium]
MRTYRDVFAQQGKAALIPFFVLGDPDFDTSLEVIKTAIDAGADVLELGIPFSDPIADGPTIQRADIRALEGGMHCGKGFDLIHKIKTYRDIPIGLLMYYNLICHYGVARFFQDAAKAGVNSVLVADLSVDDAPEIVPAMEAAGLDTVFMVTPVTTAARKLRVAEHSTGFVYAVSLLGVTGSRETLSEAVEGLVTQMKAITEVPICVGFGISTPQHAASVAAAGADGVIVGSKLVGLIEANLGDKARMLSDISAFIGAMKEAL